MAPPTRHVLRCFFGSFPRLYSHKYIACNVYGIFSRGCIKSKSTARATLGGNLFNCPVSTNITMRVLMTDTTYNWIRVYSVGGSFSKRNCLATGSSARILPDWQGVARGGRLAKERNRPLFQLATTYLYTLPPRTYCNLVGYRRGPRPQVVWPDRELLAPPSQVAEQTLFVSRQTPRDYTPREVAP